MKTNNVNSGARSISASALQVEMTGQKPPNVTLTPLRSSNRGRGGPMGPLRSLLVGMVLVVFVAGVPAASPVELVSTLSLAGVKGRIDHLSADPPRHRIFVAALGNDTVEVLDTDSDHRRTIAGLGEPQGVLYLPDFDRLFIASGGSNRVDLVDVATLSVVRRVGGMDDADNVRYDASARKVWVGYGKGSLRLLEPASGESVGEIPLPGHPESFQLEQGGSRAFVNVPTARSVFVVDRTKRQVIDRWETPDASANFPMALDENGHRLFVGTRAPPVLLVYDTGSGKVVARLPIGKDTDDVFFDAVRKRIYVICGEGKLNVFRQDSPDRYVMDESLDTAPRARTGLFVPEAERLYVAAPAIGATPARILVYRVR
jgi:DNA-binding beta-propeller fold protein YncE